jgi:hypothetical protein
VGPFIHSMINNVHIGHIERLRVDVSIHRLRKELAELIRSLDPGRSENRLIGILPGAGIVIVIGRHADLRLG